MNILVEVGRDVRLRSLVDILKVHAEIKVVEVEVHCGVVMLEIYGRLGDLESVVPIDDPSTIVEKECDDDESRY